MPYGQGAYASIPYAGTGAAPLSIKVTPAFGLGLGAHVPELGASLTVRAAFALALDTGPRASAGVVIVDLQAATGLPLAPGAPLTVGIALPSLQVAVGLGTVPGGLLEPSTGSYQSVLPALVLAITTTPQFGVSHAITVGGFGLVLSITPVIGLELAPSPPRAAFGLGLGAAGRVLYVNPEPPGPPPTPNDILEDWPWWDGSFGTIPESEPIDMSYNDPALVGAMVQGDYLDMSYTDAPEPAVIIGSALDLSYADTTINPITPSDAPIDLSFSDASSSPVQPAEPVDLSYNDAHP